MHKFVIVDTPKREPVQELRGAHLLGADGIPVRGSVTLSDGVIHCDPRVAEPVALSLLWETPDFGLIQLETTRLPPRDQPFVLQLELARHRLLRISAKREEWGLYDYPGMDDVAQEIDAARDKFIEALEHLGDLPRCATLAEESLALGLSASEHMSQFHASVFLTRRQQARGFSHAFLGTAVPAGLPDPGMLGRVTGKFDFVRVPFVWRDIQPKENDAAYEAIDAWIKTAKGGKLGIHGGPLLSFGVRSLPDWMYIWENDYETIFEMAREHVRRTVKRYSKDVRSWIVCSGMHANDALSLNLQHMIELTRMACSVTRRTAANAHVIIDITQPWGEYFARNQRTVPPTIYAEMVAQSGISFDGFGLQFLFGLDSSGYRLRDLLQISALIDRLANLGKPLHITAVSAPSTSGNGAASGGQWRQPWSQEVQAEWLQAFLEIALSRPFVETVCLNTLADGLGDGFPASGVLTDTLEPKTAFNRLVEFRRQLRDNPA